MTGKPSVLFVCVHDAGESQLAAGLMGDLVRDAVDVHLGTPTSPQRSVSRA
jgi:protein-tyrosine-phosphatase